MSNNKRKLVDSAMCNLSHNNAFDDNIFLNSIKNDFTSTAKYFQVCSPVHC